MKLKAPILNTALILSSLLAIFLILEAISRIFVNFEADYYSISKKNENNFIIHPYGKIPVNSHGFFDNEFNFGKKDKIVAYFGDSVTYGVGAGYPYRFTEYLDEIDKNFEHINLSGGLGISLNNWNTKYENFLIENNVKRIVYMMNLNDIAPLNENFLKENNELNNKKKQNSGVKNISSIKNFIKPFDNLLRGQSVFYTYIRFLVKKQFVKAGYEASGYESVELFPKKNKTYIINASKTIDAWLSLTRKKGLKSCVVVLPYEMQISKDAENYYKSINIKFEEDFVNFSTQKIIKKNLQEDKNFFFINNEGFDEKEIGSYFVFDKGDKIDFNHPNRSGHLVIAQQINKKKICQN
jgi:hypothetical protein